MKLSSRAAAKLRIAVFSLALKRFGIMPDNFYSIEYVASFPEEQIIIIESKFHSGNHQPAEPQGDEP